KEFKISLKNKTVALLAFLFAGFAFWILVQLLYIFYGFSLLNWLKSLPYITLIFSHMFAEITAKTEIGIFYLFSGSSLFFLPVPLEILFLNMLKDISFSILLPSVLLGIIAGQIINYFLGRFFGFVFRPFLKKRTKEKIRKRLEKYGIFAVFLIHILPFPFQFFNLVCGIFRYRFFKWFSFMTLGLLVKHIILYFIHIKFF
ncbi:hypothetical protein GF361_01980, partial [Candidatus Woesearchaeota archaeon]|nr:hypothetical protein [Candidatus Woesearchaeota archaeon]